MTENIEDVISDNTEVICNALTQSVILHWQQVHMFTEQSRHFDVWGYKELATRYEQEAEYERLHAKLLYERLEFYNVVPIYDMKVVSWPRHDIVGTLDTNLKYDYIAQGIEKNGIKVARDNNDEITAQIFIELLKGSEDGIKENNTDLKIIEQIGVQNYLTLKAN